MIDIPLDIGASRRLKEISILQAIHAKIGEVAELA
jgi:hypothetical protein